MAATLNPKTLNPKTLNPKTLNLCGRYYVLEPEVDIAADDKAEAERMLQYELVFYLGALPPVGPRTR